MPVQARMKSSMLLKHWSKRTRAKLVPPPGWKATSIYSICIYRASHGEEKDNMQYVTCCCTIWNKMTEVSLMSRPSGSRGHSGSCPLLNHNWKVHVDQQAKSKRQAWGNVPTLASFSTRFVTHEASLTESSCGMLYQYDSWTRWICRYVTWR